MSRVQFVRMLQSPRFAIIAAASMLATSVAYGMGDMHKTTVFKGAKVNGGTVTHEMKDGKHVLTLSDDFKTPDTPAPHWQVVESKGNVYLLNRLMVKGGLIGGDKFNKTITLPSYIQDIAKVQIWCAWAEVLLGEASFETPIK